MPKNKKAGLPGTFTKRSDTEDYGCETRRIPKDNFVIEGNPTPRSPFTPSWSFSPDRYSPASRSITGGIRYVASFVWDPPPRTTASFPPQTSAARSRIRHAMFQ